MSFFQDIKIAPADPILGLAMAYLNDPRKNKVNLGIGQYRTASLKPLILNAVKKAEERLIREEKSKDYLPIDGDSDFIKVLANLIFTKKCPYLEDIYGVQTVGSTAALAIGARLLFQAGCKHIFLANYTWPNHNRIFTHAGFKTYCYPYYNEEKKNFDLDALCAFLSAIPEKSSIVLQASSHNPTGVDPTLENWDVIFTMMKKREIFPIIDFAYQGFGYGVEEDAAPIRLLVEKQMEWFVAYSCAKNFGLYSERAGALFCYFKNLKISQSAISQLKVIVRSLYSTPPSHGARIVSTILSDKELETLWREELHLMRERIRSMREALVEKLLFSNPKKSSDFGFLGLQKGMFSYTGLSEPQVEKLIEKFAIYLPKDGRINIAGLSLDNLSYVADAICSVKQDV